MGKGGLKGNGRDDRRRAGDGPHRQRRRALPGPPPEEPRPACDPDQRGAHPPAAWTGGPVHPGARHHAGDAVGRGRVGGRSAASGEAVRLGRRAASARRGHPLQRLLRQLPPEVGAAHRILHLDRLPSQRRVPGERAGRSLPGPGAERGAQGMAGRAPGRVDGRRPCRRPRRRIAGALGQHAGGDVRLAELHRDAHLGLDRLPHPWRRLLAHPDRRPRDDPTRRAASCSACWRSRPTG